MKKQDKIGEVIKLLSGGQEAKVLTQDEIIFLQGRNVDINAEYKQPLMIYPSDSKEIEAKIQAIAGKLQYPVIRIIHKVAAFPDPEPGKVVYFDKPVKQGSGEAESGRRLPDLEQTESVLRNKDLGEVETSERSNDSSDLSENRNKRSEIPDVEPKAREPGVKIRRLRITEPNLWDDDEESFSSHYIKPVF